MAVSQIGPFSCLRLSRTKPGGCVEITEHGYWPVADDDSLPKEHFYNVWGATIRTVGAKWGKTFDVWENSRVLLEQAGFVDVVERRFRWPCNAWSKDPKLRQLGQMNQSRIVQSLEGFVLRLFTNAGWTPERAQVFMAEMRMCLKDTSVHAYLPVTVAYGRKPG